LWRQEKKKIQLSQLSKTVKSADELFSEQTSRNEYNNLDNYNSYTLKC